MNSIQKKSESSQIVSFESLPKFVQTVSKSFQSCDVVSLVGEIGSGKSTFVFALAQHLGLTSYQDLSSPTFTILNQYQLKRWVLHHVDLYRLAKYTDLENLDILKYFGQDNSITFVEWGDKFKELQPYYTKVIQFEYLKGQLSTRRIRYAGF